jgi:hypothetical protein
LNLGELRSLRGRLVHTHFLGAVRALSHFHPRGFGAKAAITHVFERRYVSLGASLLGAEPVDIAIL